jgi:hypothetical protein
VHEVISARLCFRHRPSHILSTPLKGTELRSRTSQQISTRFKRFFSVCAASLAKFNQDLAGRVPNAVSNWYSF